MTPEIFQLGDQLRATPTRWTDLTVEQQAVLCDAFRPHPRNGFTPDQMQWIRKWFLDCTDTALTGATATNGSRYVCADLLTDAVEGRRLAHMLPVLQNLTLVYGEEIEWPKQTEY